MAAKARWLFLGALSVLVVLETTLRLLPTPTATRVGQYIDPFVTTYPPGHAFRTATGWSLLNARQQQANEHGFIPSRAFQPTPNAIALIGDSLVEQSMLPPEQRLASVLQVSGLGAEVYAMGVPGSSLFDYLERVRYARDQLGVRNFWIVIERADVRESLCATGVYTDACMDGLGEIRRIRRPPRSALYNALGESAVLQYFVGVLRLSPRRLATLFRPVSLQGKLPSPPPGDVDGRVHRSTSAVSIEEQQVIDRFVNELSAMPSLRIGLLIDPVVGSLHRDDEFIDQSLAQLSNRAHQLGIPAIHPRRELALYSAKTGLEMHIGPYDAHWNMRANCVVAKEMTFAWSQDIRPHELFHASESSLC
jgi:hypothetical protein